MDPDPLPPTLPKYRNQAEIRDRLQGIGLEIRSICSRSNWVQNGELAEEKAGCAGPGQGNELTAVQHICKSSFNWHFALQRCQWQQGGFSWVAFSTRCR